jgi:multiple sugar transport system substrate-binding protein
LCGCAQKDNRTEIQFASWGSKSEIDVLKPVLLDFEKNNPDIKVEFMHIPQNYFQKIHLLFASNTAPDVIFINNLYLPVYAEHLQEMPRKQGFYPQALDALSFRGKLYAIPRDVSNLVVFYNKDLFDKKKINYPTKDWTLNDFLQIAQSLTDNKTFGISFEEEPLFYLPYFMSMGGSFYDINSPESISAIDFYSNLRNKYHVAPKKSESASATMAQMFLQERVAMYISGCWVVPKFREEASFNWDIVQFPKGTKGSIVQLDASGWAISKSSKHKKEAMKLVDYLSSKESIEKFAQCGLIVPAREDVSNIILEEQKPEHAKVFLDIIATSKPTPVSIDYREVLDKIKNDLEPKFNK